MAILKKPYTLAVYGDILQSDGSFTEERICIIGSDKMQSQSRALEPNLIRNVNGQNKFSFKMYKKYIDITSGEKIENPFTEWLVSERKVKLHYDGKWYDFVIKDIAENSSNYLYTYSLEDANVQELSKNGFGITLDAELMNNVGSAQELGEKVMEETDWSVEGSDVIVQTVDEALVYVVLPADTWVWHLLDQNPSDPSVGAIPESTRVNLGGQTVLAFYSSCKNKPHRFQFIYANNGDYGKNADGIYKISRKDNRIINEKNCQYYIDFNNPESDYQAPNLDQNSLDYDLYLPKDFIVKSMSGGTVDTSISTWYRGARYGFSQQAVYVPLLERYCQKFERDTNIDLTSKVLLHKDGSPEVKDGNGAIIRPEGGIGRSQDGTYTKATPYTGIKLDLPYDAYSTYVVSYTLEVKGGNLKRIGGHNQSFDTWFSVYEYDGSNIGNQIGETTSSSYIDLSSEPTKIKVIGKYIKKEPTSKDYSPYIFIQPNRGLDTSVSFTISDLQVKIQGEYYGYTDTEYVSPTLIQNCITNYNFKSNSGWTATQTTKVSSETKPSAEGVYGRFVDNTFKSIVNDYFEGTYADTNTYKSYMKLEFKADNQFVLNSGIRDNRTVIKNMPKDEEWVLDYKIVDAMGEQVLDSTGFQFFLKEFIYNKDSGAYSERSGSISLTSRAPTETEAAGLSTGLTRKIFTVNTNNYTEDQFKGKNGANGTYLQLQIVPPNADDSNNFVPAVYYIEHIALYRKSLDKNGNIIVPDYEVEESAAAQNYVDSGTLEHKYNYFNTWHVDGANPKKCTDKETLPLHTTTTLKYDIYKPVYNEMAQKIRSVSVKESNYFNILQSIAETFEQWLVISIERNDDGSIKTNGKKISFKNYRGDNNYACFRYGVNLKDIQRTYTSKNIVTKLIVKANSNELGKDGLCTIQRAGANPTGENYIYDFQYYQNTGLMDVNNYLTTNYYLDDAVGNDVALWTDGGDIIAPSETQQTNINGYFLRLKKINDAILPLNKEIIGLRADLVQEEAKKEVAEAQKEAALSGIEQTRLDFHALTGIYPEDAQEDVITSIVDSSIVVTPQDNWYTEKTLDSNNKPTAVKNWSYNATDKTVSISLSAIGNDTQVTPRDIILTQGATEVSKSSGKYRVKSHKWDGLYVDYAYENGITYLLSYDFEIMTPDNTSPPVLKNIGCHNTSFANNFEITVKGINNSVDTYSESSICQIPDNLTTGKFHVSVKGMFNSGANENSKPCLYIQPNRGEDTSEIEYVVSNIKLYEVGTNNATSNYDRPVSVYVKAELNVKGYADSIERTIEVKGKIPAKSNTTTLTAQFTVVDITRSDVQGYIQELTTYRQSHQDAVNTLTKVKPIITAKQNAMDTKIQLREQYLNWKKQLNKLFFQHYCRFIQEGTWINEEYADDEKYYADAQSVMYNSCYPQVAYTINVLELSQLPGYELFKFDLGDKTQVIDDDFFGEGYREEVIIAELSEMLDDPSKNTIKVQNFKNQFQDLFQKITATVQQTQYSAGSYEKGAAFLQASEQKKSEFITNAINNAKSYLSAGQTVESGPAGITITDDSDKKRQLRLVGGAILFSAEDPETKETKWRTGLTNEGISADLITAGRLDAGAVQIMNGDDPVFRWDAYGISAYEARWDDSAGLSVIDSINTKKFVRFDKHGIYGINGEILDEVVDGANWHPNNINDVDQKATFALTWKGLKVTGENGVIARLGKLDGSIFKITNGTQNIIDVQNDGTSKIGNITIGKLASTDNISEAVNNLEIGGRNLIKLANITSRNCKLNKNSTNSIQVTEVSTGNTSAILINEEYPEGTYVFNATSTITNKSIRMLFNYQYDDKCTYNEYYDNNYHYPYYRDDITLPLTLTFTQSTKIGFVILTDSGDQTISALKLEKGNKATDWTPAPEDVQAEIKATEELVSSVQDDLQKQIDGEITSWFYEGNPTIDNEPAKNWATDEEKIKHLGDLYYNTTSGAAYRWASDNNNTSFGWIVITDEAIAKALDAANTAQKTANSKMTVYNSLTDSDGNNISPSPGDLLIPSTDSSTYKKDKVYKYNGSTWTEINYTDQDALDAAKTELQGQITAITEDYSNPEGIFVSGVKNTITKDYIEEFDIQAASLIVYDKDNSYEEDGVTKYRTIFSAQASKDKDGKPENGVVSLAGWTVTSKQLTTGTIGTAGSFGIYPNGVSSSSLNTDFIWESLPSDDSWVMTSGKSFGLTKNGALYASSGKIGGFNIDQNWLTNGDTSENECVGKPNIVFLRPAGTDNTYTIGGESQNGWVFTIDNKFGVDKNGGLYCSDIHINGGELNINNGVFKVYNTGRVDCSNIWATGGKIGSFEILEESVGPYLNMPGTLKASFFGSSWDEGTEFSQAFDRAKLFDIYSNIKYNNTTIRESRICVTPTNLWLINYQKNGSEDFGYLSRITPTSLDIGSSHSLSGDDGFLDSMYYQVKILRITQLYDYVSFNTKLNNFYFNAPVSWSTSSPSGSDIRIKNSIETIPDKYEKFFDLMQPTRYKYNDGTSNRYHTGFIAQWLVENLENSGLTTQDFAGVMLDRPGTEYECWHLRRDEFVALNTWQIQKLKPRVSALEQTILDYETRISTLEQQIQKLISL